MEDILTILPEQNLLGGESSPYLRQHKDNPVHWRPWSADALEEASRLDRPILLSIGYAACHWCHVMAHESFENEETGALMNRLFVNIKVDREERPDIDQIYMAALTSMGEQGGWPLTIFLTPDAQPFWGGTYFPPEPRFGRPGFRQVLEAISRTWNEKRDDLVRSASALTTHVGERLAPRAGKGGIDEKTLPTFADAIHTSIDPERGGLKGAPKFPNAPFMNILWLNWIRNGNEAHRDAVVHSLRSMLAGGIYDHLGGGLCRYATDDEWLVPHFEKMLYDNAQMIDLATTAYSFTGEELFRVRIEETVAWLFREMTNEEGGFLSSLDADSEGKEGKFYLWTADEISEVLSATETEAFLSEYQLSAPAGWEGDPILNRLHNPSYGRADFEPDILRMKRKLMEKRAERIRPGRDDKVLVDWNGLAIAALARAGRAFGHEEWVEGAARAFRFVSESQSDGRLPHSILGESRLFPGLSTDYAAMIEAAVALYEATSAQAYLDQAGLWMDILDRFYRDGSGIGYYLTATDSADVPIRVRGDVDEAAPSASSQVIEAMVRLSLAASRQELYERAVVVAEHAIGRIVGQRYGQAGIVHAAELARQPKKLIIADGPDGDFVSAANRFSDPSRTDVRIGLEGKPVTLPDGATIDTTRTGAWLCIGQACLPPVRTAEDLAGLLREPA